MEAELFWQSSTAKVCVSEQGCPLQERRV